MIKKILCTAQSWLNATRAVGFLGPLALRLYLVPIFWLAGANKLMHIDSTIAWFKSMGFMLPTLMAYLASVTEVLGAILLLIGLGVRWISIPLMAMMLVAMFSVHWENGWLAIAHSSSDAAQRLNGFLEWLEGNHPGRHSFITELAQPVALNNGIEFAATYFIMLLNLFFIGSGKYLSVDYWLSRWVKPRCND